MHKSIWSSLQTSDLTTSFGHIHRASIVIALKKLVSDGVLQAFLKAWLRLRDGLGAKITAPLRCFDAFIQVLGTLVGLHYEACATLATLLSRAVALQRE